MNRLSSTSEYRRGYRIIAFMLTVVMCFSMLPSPIFANVADETQPQPVDDTDANVAPVDVDDLAGYAVVESIDGLSFTLEWADSMYKDDTSLNIVENNPVVNQARLKVSYSCAEVREAGYAPGELIITVKGIGNVNRSGVIEAFVGADKQSASTKVRDWSYTWNKANDTYTFVNNQAIKPNSVFSGYFELVWEFDARDSINGYSQDNIQAIIYLPDGESLKSDVLSFSNKTMGDDFQVYIEKHEMYSYEGLTDGIDNPDDYAFVRYDVSAFQTTNSRGLESDYFVFDPDVAGIGSSAIIISPNMSATPLGDGSYKVGMHLNTDTDIMDGKEPVENYIFVAYPKNEYGDQLVNASVSMYGDYYEGSDDGIMDTHLLSSADVMIPIPADFTFIDITGDVYDFWKDTWYDKYVKPEITYEKGGDIAGSKMTNNTVETFYLEGVLRNVQGDSYTLELVDDFMYIMKNNGTFRALAAHEYEFTTVTIPSVSEFKNLNGVPIAADTYNVYVYATQNGEVLDLMKSSYEPIWTGLISESQNMIELPANTTAVAIVIRDVVESIAHYYIPVTVKYHLDDTTVLEYGEQDNLTSGQVVNVSFIRVFSNTADGGYEWFNNGFSEINYEDQTNLHTPDKDMAVYGTHLDREKDNITFYEGDRSNYYATTDVGDISIDGPNQWSTIVTLGGVFEFVDEDHPNEFSLYTVLPEYMTLSDYSIPEDIWDNLELSGMGLTSEQLAAACVPEIIEDYNGTGRTYIALHFDFDSDVYQKTYIEATFSVDMNSYRNAYVRSALVIDSDVNEVTLNKKADDGKWGDVADVFADIDGDGNVDELLASSFAYRDVPTYADSSQLQLTKFVKTSYSDGWVQLPEIPYEDFGGSYQYRLSLTNGNSIARNIVISDIIESGGNTQWQGFLQSVAVENEGVAAVVKYGDGNGNWSDDYATYGENARAVSVEFGEFELSPNSELAVILTMKAPAEDAALLNKVAENGYSASMTMYDAKTGNETKYDDLTSNFVQVQLTYPLTNIIITKRDAETQQGLQYAKFELIDKETGEVVATEESNAKGYVIFRNALAGRTYIIREIEAPYGYMRVDDIEVDVGDDDVHLTIDDMRDTGTIEIHKTNALDGETVVADAEYSLLDVDGNVIATVVTDDMGIASFSNVAWGSYVVKETKSPEGYVLNGTEYSVEITRENVSNVVVIETEDAQAPVNVHLVKYAMTASGEPTTTPLSEVAFELVRKDIDGDKRVGIYLTDENGCIDVTDLAYGEYYFREYRVPSGYIMADDVSFELTPTNRDVSMTVYNKQRTGSVVVTKADSVGNMVSDIEFTLYASDKKTVIATAITDDYGIAQFNDLSWGTYYIKETNTPSYYIADNEFKKVVISENQLSVALTVINETVKGIVKLVKVDAETKQYRLSGAEFTLYGTDGLALGSYVTDDDGIIQIDDLEWGSYYFKETKAPDGYGLTGETIRFSINASNAGVVQEIVVENPKDMKHITLRKSIKVSDINWANGDPTFIFKVIGTDVNGNKHTYHQIVIFDKEYVEKNAVDGYVSQDVIIGGITAGEYTAFEVDTSRYVLQEVKDVVHGNVSGETVVFNLIDNPYAAATFVNSRYENQGYSDTQNITNILKATTKLTALDVTYGQSVVQADSDVNRSILSVTAIYDDGSAKVLSAKDYDLSIERFPNLNGMYTVIVSYTDGGITRTDSFTVEITGAKLRIVSLEAGMIIPEPVLVGSNITNDMYHVIAVYNTGERKVLSTDEFTIDTSVAPSTERSFDLTVSLNLAAIPNDGYGVSTVVAMQTINLIPMLETGIEFAGHIPSGVTSVVFTDVAAPAGAIDVSADKNGLVKAWQDGTTFYVSSLRSGVPVYANPNSSYMFQNKSEITSIEFGSHFTVSTATNISYMFYRCTGLLSVDAAGFDTKNVTNMAGVFWHCDKLESITFGDGWNTAKVTNFGEMFRYCYKLKELDVSMFSTGNSLYMNAVFSDCYALTSIKFGSGWNFSKATNMTHFFYNCKALQSLDLSQFTTTHNVMWMDYMFAYCESLTELDVTPLNTSAVNTFDHMFYNMTKVKYLDCSGFDTTKASKLSYMFANCTALEQVNVKGQKFITTNVSTMAYMFRACQSLTSLDLSGFDMYMDPVVTYMFFYCNAVETAYARTSSDAERLNASATEKPDTWSFVVP